jgi:2-polyprenyl-3-methyl-5-hydroxy-6-metoxy-1,4-benzoquinol methylase
MAKSMVDCFQPRTVIDVGCGTGALLEAFRNLNCQVCGLEYSEAALAYCRKRELPVRKFNIGRDQIDRKQYDLAVSFEVAEHLAPWTAERFVDLLCRSSSLVVISAAIPGQGGVDHINEQPRSYWIAKFKRRSFVLDEKTTNQFSSDWKLAGISLWYHENVMVFERSR